MNQRDLEAIILERTYKAYFHSRDSIDLHALCEELGLHKTPFWNIVEQMASRDLIRADAMGGYYTIGLMGILFAEEQNIVAEEVKGANQQARDRILDKLAAVYETEGSYADVDIASMAKEFEIGANILATNLEVLEGQGFIQSVSIGSYKIALIGLEVVTQWREKLGFGREYEHISKMAPQPRGRALQQLVARIVEEQGWSQEEGARTSHEEMDVIIHREREYFLIECKWEKDAIEAPIIRELHGKLSNRIGVQGIVVSMSGFTSGAVEQAQDYASSRIILLYGRGDIEQVVYQQASFDKLLDEKYQELVTRRKITYR